MHQIMKDALAAVIPPRSNVEQAACEWAEAVAARESAGDSGCATYAQLSQMDADVKARLIELKAEALKLFKNQYDGSRE